MSNDCNSLRNTTLFLREFFNFSGSVEEMKIREQLLVGYSIFIYDAKDNLHLDGKGAHKQIIGGCTFFPWYGKGSYIGYVCISPRRYDRDNFGKSAFDKPFQGNHLSLILLFIVHKFCVDICKTKGHIYLQTRSNNPAKSKFKSGGLCVIHNEGIDLDKKDNECDGENSLSPYDPILQQDDFPHEDSLVNMSLHCDYFREICGTSIPPEVSPQYLVERTKKVHCCAGNKCKKSGQRIYLNYQCLLCFKFCHRECSRNITRSYDKERSMMLYPSPYPYSGLRWLKEIIAYNTDDNINAPIHHVLCLKCNLSSSQEGKDVLCLRRGH